GDGTWRRARRAAAIGLWPYRQHASIAWHGFFPVLAVTASPLPYLTQARAPLVREVSVTNEYGEQDTVSIPAERPLTIYVDKRELVTLMTLGALPELLVLGYLRNQRLILSAT